MCINSGHYFMQIVQGVNDNHSYPEIIISFSCTLHFLLFKIDNDSILYPAELIIEIQFLLSFYPVILSKILHFGAK